MLRDHLGIGEQKDFKANSVPVTRSGLLFQRLLDQREAALCPLAQRALDLLLALAQGVKLIGDIQSRQHGNA